MDLQKDALRKVGCKRIFSDIISGSVRERTGLNAALTFLRDSDVLVVWRLDRLGRSLKHLIEIIGLLQQRGIGFRSLTENMDTTTPGGKLVFHVFGALAEFERDLIRERTQAGLAAARARGKHGGRPTLLDENQRRLLRTLYADKSNRITDILRALHISKSTLYRWIQNPPEKADSILEGPRSDDPKALNRPPGSMIRPNRTAV
jgi:DNA invertase Pin-like site-specific DNA recombinase